MMAATRRFNMDSLSFFFLAACAILLVRLLCVLWRA